VLGVLTSSQTEKLAMFGNSKGGERARATVLMSTDATTLALQEANGFADAVVTGRDVYLSGAMTTLEDGETDLEKAYTRTFEAIGRTLANAGASWDDVVEITSFHTDLTSQMPAIVAVKSRFVKPPHAAWTAIGVSRLVADKGITEIKVIAKLPDAPA
jgi:enamine deaminase RidA (YjgF/YER057c/UK114 family)